jgi:uncharacterized membrane protein YkvA (DUF1232 family)
LASAGGPQPGLETIFGRIKAWARALRRDAYALRLAAADPRVPWAAKALAIAVAGYALSPIDLIPDFIPVLGYIDDLVLVPAGLALAIRLIPPDVMAEHRARAEAAHAQPRSIAGAMVIGAVWVGALASAAWLARDLIVH